MKPILILASSFVLCQCQSLVPGRADGIDTNPFHLLEGQATAPNHDISRLSVPMLSSPSFEKRWGKPKVLVGPKGVIGSYRKVHLPYLGIDMFTSFGDRPFDVHAAGDVKIGMQICYDASFPEASRCQALLGADLIVLPTNWPPGAECMANWAVNTRALENAVYFAAVNRVGTERGFPFIGRSRICDPSGNTLAESTGTGEEILYAEIDPARARRKHIIRVPGKHEIDRLADRRPEMYGPLIAPHTLKRPGRDS